MPIGSTFPETMPLSVVGAAPALAPGMPTPSSSRLFATDRNIPAAAFASSRRACASARSRPVFVTSACAWAFWTPAAAASIIWP